MHKSVVHILTAVIFAAGADFGLAQTAPSGMGPFEPTEPLEIVISEVAGNARVRMTPEAPWQPAVVGLKLAEGAEVHTSLRSVVKIQIDQDQVVTVDRLGVTRINLAVLQGGVAKTDLGMKYGRLNYQIETAGREHEATVRTGGSTLAVRGTEFEVYDQPPFTPRMVSYTGQVSIRDARRQVRIGSRRGGVVRIDEDKNSAAETALAETSFDPTIDAARTPAEERLIQQVISTGGIVQFDSAVGLPVVTGGVPLQFDESNASTLPGTGLNFVLNWTGDSDLNVSVALPKFGEIIAPISPLNRGQTGGITSFDHRGGANGGFEIIFYGPNFPGSTATTPPGGFVTLPGPDVTDPVSGITRPTVILPNIPGNNLTGGETYVTEIGFVRGANGAYSLQGFAVDPLTGQQVLVSGLFGEYSFDPQTGALTATRTEVLYNPPPGLPPENSAQRVASLSTAGVNSGRTSLSAGKPRSVIQQFATIAAEHSRPANPPAVKKKKR